MKRHLLGPLVRHDRGSSDRKALDRAIQKLSERALGEVAVSELRELVGGDAGRKDRRTRDDPERVRQWIRFSRALYDSRKISSNEYLILSVMHVEGIHQARWIDGQYNAVLEPLRDAMSRVRRDHGLADDEDWLLDEGPPEYRRLNDEYGAALEVQFNAVLREFGLSDLADLHEQDRVEFERRRERGRRAFHHKEELAGC